MTFMEMLGLLRRHAVLLVVLMALGAGAGGLLASRSTVAQQATGQLMISPARPEKGRDLTELSTFVQIRMETWAAMAQSAAVLAPVRAQLHLSDDIPDLASKVTVEVPPGSSILEVTVEGDDEKATVDLASAVMTSLTRQVVATTPTQAGGSPAVTTIALQAPAQAVAATRPPVQRDILFGALLGLVAAVLLARRPRREGVAAPLDAA